MFKSKAPIQGTRTYMSPEQIRGESPAATADIYSFGITCYELACGRPPFRANSEGELLNKHIRDRPNPLTSYNKEITSEFNDIILKLISKRPADRITNLHEFISKFKKIKIYKSDPDPSAPQ
jgi:serine/threonine protein kinase